MSNLPARPENTMTTYTTIPDLADDADSLREIRHHIHHHPELAFEEFATAALVAEKLAEWGYQVTRGLGGTGVVGTLKLGDGTRSIGLRADMDALPIDEADRPALRQQRRRRDARLRPRRPHRDAARRRAAISRDTGASPAR